MGSMVLKRNEAGLIEIFASGELRFRSNKFTRALGVDGGRDYATALDQVVPGGVTTRHYPGVLPAEAAKIAVALFAVIQHALQEAEGTQ